MSTFPLDDVTLSMVRAAVTPDEHGRTHLHDVLTFGRVEHAAYEHEDTMDGIPMGVGGWHHNTVIADLIDEVFSLRAKCPDPQVPEPEDG